MLCQPQPREVREQAEHPTVTSERDKKEGRAGSYGFPCKYSSGGCTVSLLHTEKVDHEATPRAGRAAPRDFPRAVSDTTVKGYYGQRT